MVAQYNRGMKQVPITLRLNPEIHRKVRQIATQEMRSLNAQFEWLLLRALEQWEREHGPLPSESESETVS